MDVNATVQGILKKVLGQSADVTAAKKGASPEWDSIATLAILFEIEQAFSIELTENEIEKLNSLASIVEVIKHHLA